MRLFISFLLLILCFSPAAHSQVIISLLLGDKLNSENLEFGLDGGLAFTSLSNLPSSGTRETFNLGFYIDLRLIPDRNLFLHTGVIVKSPMGAENLPPYALGDAALDPLLANGEVTRKLSYFNVPALLKYRFKNNLSVEAGPQLGLLNKAEDLFQTDIQNADDLTYKVKIKDELKSFDYGITAGVGYKLMNDWGMTIGVRYYWGLADIVKDNRDEPQRNSAFYLYGGIPIGTAKNKTK